MAFGTATDTLDGQAFVIFTVAVAAAESAVGLGLILALSRRGKTVDPDDMRSLRD